MARWNKLNEEEYYFSQKTLPPHEIKSAKNTEPIRYDINNYIENDDITIDDFYEQVTTLINGFQRTHQGTYLLEIAKIFFLIFKAEEHYYKDECQNCYVFGVSAIRFALLALFFDDDSNEINNFLTEIGKQFCSQYDFQRVYKREAEFITEQIQRIPPEEFVKTIF